MTPLGKHVDVAVTGTSVRYRWRLGCKCKDCKEVMKITKRLIRESKK